MDQDLVKVWFLIAKDKDGYPLSKSWEGLWCRSTPQGFEVVSIPFYLKNVSRGDLIQAHNNNFLQCTGAVKQNGHNTYRLLFAQANLQEVREAVAELKARGLGVEVSEIQILLAIDVPPSPDQQRIDEYLTAHQQKDRWEMQDGYLNFDDS